MSSRDSLVALGGAALGAAVVLAFNRRASADAAAGTLFDRGLRRNL